MSEQEQQQEQQAVFTIEKIYTKDLSLEIPNAPQIFLEREAPTVDVQLHNESRQVDEGIFESVITVTVTAKLGDKTMFLVEAAQAGIFVIRNVPQEHLGPVLGITCPNIVFPYVREVISDVVSRAGFPPVMLSPVNFEALYAQQEQAATQQPQ
jgi:preprotein translocase subunit SecB